MHQTKLTTTETRNKLLDRTYASYDKKLQRIYLIFKDSKKEGDCIKLSKAQFEVLQEKTKMGKKIGDVVKSEQVFPESESVKIETLKNKTVKINAVCRRTGKDGSYLILDATSDEKAVSFCGGTAITDSMEKYVKETQDEEIKEKILKLKEICEAKIVEKKSGEGRIYYALE